MRQPSRRFGYCQKPNRKHHLPNHAILEQSFATLAPHSSNPHHSPFTIFAITIAVLVLRHGYHISTLTRSLEVIYLQYNLASFLTSWTTFVILRTRDTEIFPQHISLFLFSIHHHLFSEGGERSGTDGAHLSGRIYIGVTYASPSLFHSSRHHRAVFITQRQQMQISHFRLQRNRSHTRVVGCLFLHMYDYIHHLLCLPGSVGMTCERRPHPVFVFVILPRLFFIILALGEGVGGDFYGMKIPILLFLQLSLFCGKNGGGLRNRPDWKYYI